MIQYAKNDLLGGPGHCKYSCLKVAKFQIRSLPNSVILAGNWVVGATHHRQ